MDTTPPPHLARPGMHPLVFDALCKRKRDIQLRWEQLLRIEKVNSPLADPAILAYLIPETIRRVFEELRGKCSPPDAQFTVEPTQSADRQPPRILSAFPLCQCGRNPYLLYFAAGEQAMVESLVLTQAASPDYGTRMTGMAALQDTLFSIAESEVTLFCSLCVHKPVGCARPPVQR